MAAPHARSLTPFQMSRAPRSTSADGPAAGDDGALRPAGDRPTLDVPVPALTRVAPIEREVAPALSPPGRRNTLPVVIVPPPEARPSRTGMTATVPPDPRPAPTAPTPPARGTTRWLPVAAGMAIGLCAAFLGERALGRGNHGATAPTVVAAPGVAVHTATPGVAVHTATPGVVVAPTAAAPAPDDGRAFELARARLDARVEAQPTDAVARGARAALLTDLALHYDGRASALETGAAETREGADDAAALRGRAAEARAGALRDLDQADRDARALPDATVRARVERSLARTRRVLSASTDPSHRGGHVHGSGTDREVDPGTITTEAPF